MAKPRRKSPSPSKDAARSKTKSKPAAAASRKPAKPAPRKAAKPAARKPAKPAAKPKPKVTAKVKTSGASAKKAAASRQPQAPTSARPSAGAAGSLRHARPAPAAPPPPAQRSTYAEALGIYVRGIQALQARKYREAADLLRSVIARFPEEKELHERAALYVRVCERQIAEAPAPPETPEERVYAATVALNNGAVDRAITILGSVLEADRNHDQACYMLGVAYAIKGVFPAALQYLGRSIALNPENRGLAWKEPDLEVLRRTDEMLDLLAAAPEPEPAAKRPAKKRKK